MSTQQARKKEKLRASVEERVRKEERAHRIVERLVLTDIVEQEFFVSSGRYITISQYKDITEERAITRLCGYPLCNTTLTKVPKQKYKISLRDKKVYDITERKNFCSNTCYKASKYYGSQLSAEPVWTRDEKKFAKDLELYSEVDHSSLNLAWTDCSAQEISLKTEGEDGQAKINIHTDDIVADDEIMRRENAFGEIDFESENDNHMNGNFNNTYFTRQDDKRDDCLGIDREKLGNIWGCEENTIIDSSSEDDKGFKALPDDFERNSGKMNHQDDDSDDNDKNDDSRGNDDDDRNGDSKHNDDDDSDDDNKDSDDESNDSDDDDKIPNQDSAVFKNHISGNLGHHFSNEPKHKMESEKQNAKQTILLDSLRGCHIGQNATTNPNMIPSRVKNENIVENVHRILSEWCTNETRIYISRSISLAKENKGFNLDERQENEIQGLQSPKKRILLPSVHSKNPVTIRGKIVSDKLKKAINPIFGQLGLTFHDIFSEITRILRTLSFTGVNIVLKPAEWTLVGFTMIYMLMIYDPVLSSLSTSQTASLRSLLNHGNVTNQDVQRLVDIFICDGNMPGTENNKIKEFDMEELD